MSQKRPKNSRTERTGQKIGSQTVGIPRRFRLQPVRLIIAVLIVVFLSAIVLSVLRGDSQSALRITIEKDFQNKRYAEAEKGWERLFLMNSDFISPADRLQWATAALRADHPASALKILKKWQQDSPEKPDGWLMILDIYRFLGQTDQTILTFNEIRNHETARRSAPVLVKATLGMLTDLDPEEVRDRLSRWNKAEPGQPIAQAALQQRYLDNPMPNDPGRDERLQTCRDLLQRFPASTQARAVLAELLMVSGLAVEATRTVENWPEADRQGIVYHRILGRYLQDIRHDQNQAIIAFQMVLQSMPHDWKTRYRLARALKAVGRHDESRFESNKMLKIREKLDPINLEPIIREAFPKGKPPVISKLTALLNDLDLDALAKSWTAWEQDQLQLKIK